MRRLLIGIALLAAVSSARAEQKNVQVLTGLTDAELQRYMNTMRASLGVNCGFCHASNAEGHLDFASDAKKEKETARDMIQMTEKINKEQFGGRAFVSCNTCHRGSTNPEALVSLPQSIPAAPGPRPPRPTMPAIDEIVKHYATAIGDASKLQTAHVYKGTRDNWDGKVYPFTIQESDDKAHLAVTTPAGDVEQWIGAAAGVSRDKNGVRAFTPEQVETFHFLDRLYEPLPPSAIPADARVIRKEKIGDHDTYLVVDRPDDKTRERLYFDTTSGLLVRRITIKDSRIGPVPQQTDYDDYRDVGGTRVPFLVKISLPDPWSSSTRHYSDVQLGAKLDDAVFTPPAETRPSS